jgi:hypothetical protein
MDLIGILIALIIIGLVFWAARALLAAFAIGEPIATVVQVLLVVFVILFLVQSLRGGGNLGIGLGSPVLRTR